LKNDKLKFIGDGVDYSSVELPCIIRLCFHAAAPKTGYLLGNFSIGMLLRMCFLEPQNVMPPEQNKVQKKPFCLSTDKTLVLTWRISGSNGKSSPLLASQKFEYSWLFCLTLGNLISFQF
jgi:hypothetical protein